MCGTLKRLWMCVFLLAATLSALAQNGQFSGQVTDQQQAAVPNAQVHVINLDTLVKVATKTDDTGQYIAPFLPSGRYRVIVEAPGFSPVTQELNLAPGQAAVLNIQLTVAEAKSTVNVEEGGGAKVETENAQVSGTINEKELVGIGLNGRNFTQLISLAPGVSNQTGQDEAKVGVLGSAKYSVNGGRTEYNTFDVDGSDVLNVGINKDNSTLNVYPSLDAIQEVKVLTSNYGAMYGRSASGTTVVTTKSGGQQFHGDAYDFLRNEVFNARNYFDPGKSAPLYRRQDFGFTIGGPLFIAKIYNTKKDRSYFFFSEEFRLEKTPTSFRHAVPSLAERRGDFNDVCPAGGGLFKRSQYPDCPARNIADVNAQQAFNSNILTNPTIAGPQMPLSRNGVALLASGIIPLPNATSGCNSTIGSCYEATVSPSTYWREELFRIDQDINSKVRLTFRYIHDSWDTTVLSPQWADIQNTFPTIQNRFFGPGTDMVLRTTQVFSPSLLNEVVASYTNLHITLTDVNGPGANFQRPAALNLACAPDPTNTLRIQCPMGYLFNNGFGGKIPGIVIAGNNAAYGGAGFAVDAGYMPWDHTDPTYTFGDNVSKVIGKHTLQFGGSLIVFQRNQTNGPSGATSGDVQGILTFSNVRGFHTTGNAFADVLNNLGGTLTAPAINGIASYQQDSTQSRYHQRYTVAEPYFQDDWKVTQHLTFNLGMRLSLFGTFHDHGANTYNWVPSAFDPSLASRVATRSGAGGGALFDPQTGKSIPLDLNHLDPRLTNGLVQCGANGVPDGCMSGHLFNFAPRIGFAWDPTGSGKVSIRGGYGVFYEHGTAGEANTGSLEGGAPRVLDMTQNTPSGYACIGGVSNGCLSAGLSPGAYPLNVTSIRTKAVWPYVQQWSMSIEHQLPANLVVGLAYVGSKGTHLTTQLQINQVAPLPLSENPFGINEPLLTTGLNRFLNKQGGDCGGAFNGNGFKLLNGTFVTLAQPAAINLYLACFGAFGTDTFPDPNGLRPYRGLGQIYSLQNVADSHYNAMQFTLRRTQGPLELSLAYTFSHSLDDSSDRSDATFVNSFDLRSNRASSNFDQRHLVNISYIYQLPFYRHMGPGFLRTFLGGWSLSGLTTYQSGTPFSVINGGSPGGIGVVDNGGVANGTGLGSYPDIVSSPRAAGPAGGNNAQSFGPLLGNPGAFVAPRGLTFGNAGRNSMNNPSRLNFDMALLKSFPVLGERTIEFRAEAFNVFNHTQFRIYDPNLGNTGSNTISCYSGAKSNYSAAGGDGVDCLTGSAFLHPVNAHRPRTMQLGLKFNF